MDLTALNSTSTATQDNTSIAGYPTRNFAMVQILLAVQKMLESRAAYIEEHPDEGCMDADTAETAIEPIVNAVTEHFRNTEDFDETLLAFALEQTLSPAEKQHLASLIA